MANITTPQELASTPSIPTTHKWSINTPQELNASPNVEDESYIKHTQKLKEVRHLLHKVKEDPFEGLVAVDALQRLGIDYHFQEEIDSILKRHYMETTYFSSRYECRDLLEVSLAFRLLRQEGYYVPTDVFESFKDKAGIFEVMLKQDIKGLMSLYEASQLSIDGEDILEEAANFSSHLLKEVMTFLHHDQATMVRNTLAHSYRNSTARFGIKDFIKDYKGTILQELAQIDFNLVQSIHQSELVQITRWWKELGLAQQLKLARDQPLKWYIWPMAMLEDPSLSEQRVELTKTISLIYIIDDIFDIYGTLDELTLFTEAVKRWDIDAIEQLPDYMKICFKSLYDITNEIGYKVYKGHGFNPIDSLRKTWATLCNAFLAEGRWFASGHLPTAEEYLKNGTISSGAHVVLAHLFFLLGDGKTKDSASLVEDHNQGIISSVATILRLWDDLGSAKDENQNGHDGSYVMCYMNEHKGTSIQMAQEHVINRISNMWKRLNKECLAPNPYSATFRKASLNSAKMIPLMYNYDDNHSLPLLEKNIKSMLCDRLCL